MNAEDIFKEIELAETRRAEKMPDTVTALKAICEAKHRMRSLGWKEGQYCPKKGEPFAVIEFGSSGIFRAFYSGDWPDGRIYADDYLVHPHGCMWKPLEDLTDDERTQIEKCDARTVKNIERDAQRFIGLPQDGHA